MFYVSYKLISTIDINECSNKSTNNCDEILATCFNADGSFMCMCDLGYTGSGIKGSCEGNIRIAKS